MKKRHLYTLFDQVNEEIFDGMLPYTKLIISKKDRDLFGLCNISGFHGQNVSSHKITLFYTTMRDYDRFNTNHIKSILIHEMVHLWIAIKLKRDFSTNINKVEEHDEVEFGIINQLAIELGYIDKGTDLLC